MGIEVPVGQYQQLVEQLQPQVMHQPQGNLGQKVVAQKRTQSLPGGNQDNQQRHRLQQLQVAQVRYVGKQHRLRIAQAIDKILEDASQHWLGRREDHETYDAEQKDAYIGFHITEQPKIDFQAGALLHCWW
ncbi:hypothetical protein D9M71_120360 [compost metagenome]